MTFTSALLTLSVLDKTVSWRPVHAPLPSPADLHRDRLLRGIRDVGGSRLLAVARRGHARARRRLPRVRGRVVVLPATPEPLSRSMILAALLLVHGDDPGWSCSTSGLRCCSPSHRC